MSPRLATYATWEELYGRKPSLDEVIQHLRKLDRLHTVLLLARVNIQLAMARFHDNPKETIALQRFLISNFFDDEIFEKLKEKYGSEKLDHRLAFHTQQILTVAKWALLEQAPTGGIRPDEDQQARYTLGRCLVMANDLLLAPEMARAISRKSPSRKRKLVAMQLQLGSGSEINNPPDVKSGVVRSDIMFGEILDQIKTPLDVKYVFKKKTGLELAAYVDMVFGVLAHYVAMTHDEVMGGAGRYLVNLRTFFNLVPTEDARKFWNMELASLDELTAELSNPSVLKPQHDFIVFRRKPLFQVGEESAVCTHFGFLQEKLESGLFWSILNSLDTDEDREHLFHTWGQLFERYITHVLGKAINRDSEQYVSFPRFADNNNEAFDGIVVAGKKWIVLEYKGGFLKGEAKYAENEKEFVRDLQLKFGVEGGAGVEQLVRKIGHVFAAKTSTRRQIDGLDASGVTIVVPVLVVQEPFVSSVFTAQYLCYRYRHLRGQQRLVNGVCCTGLLVLDVEDLEAMRPYAISRKITFSDCILRRAQLGDNCWLDFREFFQNYLQERRIEPTSDVEVEERFEQIMDRICRRFFNHPFERRPEGN